MELEKLFRKEQLEYFINSSLSPADILTRLDEIDQRKLAQLVEDHFDKPEVYRALKIIFAAIDISSNVGNFNPYNYYIKLFNILGSGAQGQVASAGFNGKTEKPILAIKSQEKPNDIEINSLKREFLVGWILNSYHRQTPIFSHMISMNGCSGLVMSGKKKILSFCENKSSQASVISTLAGIPIDMYSFSDYDFIRVFLLLLDGLNKAKKSRYVHYDLHPGNILIKELKKEMAFPINLRGRKEYLVSKYVPVIIDYGLSRIDYLDKVSYPREVVLDGDYLNEDMIRRELAITKDYFPMQDIYRFLFSWLWINKEVKLNQDLVRFFEPNLNKEVLQRVRKGAFRAPRNFIPYQILDYFNWLQNQSFFSDPLISEVPTGVHLYGSGDKINVFRYIGMTDKKSDKISSSIDWYLYYYLDNSKDQIAHLNRINSKYPQFYSSFLKQIDHTLSFVRSNKNFLQKPFDQQLLVMGKLGDLIVALKNEDIAIGTIKKYFKLDQPEADEKLKKLMLELRPYQSFYNSHKKELENVAYPG